MMLEEQIANILNWVAVGIGAIVLLAIVASMLYVVKQWEKVAVIRLGRIVKVVETGLHAKIPLLDSIRRVDLRTQTVDLKGQSAITRDNISVAIDTVVFMKVEDPKALILRVYNYWEAVAKFAQTAIRDIVGRYNLDDLLESREEIATTLGTEIDKLVKEWGIDIPKTGIQDIGLPADMKRAFAVQAEAEREAKAVRIRAKAELEASQMLMEAGKKLEESSNAMQLRILTTIDDVSKDQSNTIILALPLETLKAAGVQGVASLSAIRPKFQKG